MTNEQVTEVSTVQKSFTKEQLHSRAQEFMRWQCGDVRTMQPSDQRHYHEISGILMLCIEHIWKQG